MNRKYDPLITKLSSHPYPRSRDLPPPRSLPRFIFRLESGRAIVACPREIEIDTSTFATGNKSILLFLLPSNEKQARDGRVFFLFHTRNGCKRGRRPYKHVQRMHVGGRRLIYYHVAQRNSKKLRIKLNFGAGICLIGTLFHALIYNTAKISRAYTDFWE